MNRTLSIVSAVGAGLMSAAGLVSTSAAQTAAPQATAPTTQAAAVPPQAISAKIALIEFEQVAAATNEGQRSLQAMQKKYEPKKAQLDTLSQEIESLKKQLQSAPATLSEDERASRLRAIDTKQKQLTRDAEDAQAAYSTDVQESVGKIAQKLGPIVIKYVQQNGYTMLLDNTGQQGGVSVLWTLPGTDISQAIVEAYNASSGIEAPVPSAPSAARPRSVPPKPAAAPKP